MTLGSRAIIIGAGIGGLAAAAALAGRFREVLILDRDALPGDSAVRLGAGQGAHLHQLLKAGELALERLVPGITQDFVAAGAVTMRVGRDLDVYDFGGPQELCDAGFDVTSLSRPAYEAALRRRVSALPGVAIRDETPVRRFVVDNAVCKGVELEDDTFLAADLIVDSSGMTAPLLTKLAGEGHAEFNDEVVRINVAYTTARFRRPGKYRDETRGFFFLPAPPHTHFGFLLPMEDNQWILSLGARGGGAPSRDAAGFKEYAKGLPTSEVWQRVRDAEVVGDLRTFRKPTASRRLLWEAKTWPERLLVIGDAMSSVNPTYGQGMTVAALEADALAGMLAKREAAEAGLTGLPAEYFAGARDISGRAWSLSTNSDYVYPETEGERPANFAMSRAMAATLRKLADEDVAFRIVRYRLVHMLDDASALREGPLGIRFFTALQGSMA